MQQMEERTKINPYIKLRKDIILSKQIERIFQKFHKQMMRKNNEIQISNNSADEGTLSIEQKQVFTEVLHCIQEWQKITMLLITSLNINQSFLFEFGSIKFLNLLELNLWNNNIQSVEALSELQAPHLTTLVLSQNKIISIKPLRRMQTAHLNKLYIMNNYIKDFQFICQFVCFSRDNFQRVSIDWKDEEATCQNLNFLAKASPVLSIGHYGKKIIKQPHLEAVLSSRGTTIIIS